MTPPPMPIRRGSFRTSRSSRRGPLLPPGSAGRGGSTDLFGMNPGESASGAESSAAASATDNVAVMNRAPSTCAVLDKRFMAPFSPKIPLMRHLIDPLQPSVFERDDAVEPAGEVAAVVIMALSLSFLATIYPSWRAARLDPVEALRYE